MSGAVGEGEGLGTFPEEGSCAIGAGLRMVMMGGDVITGEGLGGSW